MYVYTLHSVSVLEIIKSGHFLGWNFKQSPLTKGIAVLTAGGPVLTLVCRACTTASSEECCGSGGVDDSSRGAGGLF